MKFCNNVRNFLPCTSPTTTHTLGRDVAVQEYMENGSELIEGECFRKIGHLEIVLPPNNSNSLYWNDLEAQSISLSNKSMH